MPIWFNVSSQTCLVLPVRPARKVDLNDSWNEWRKPDWYWRGGSLLGSLLHLSLWPSFIEFVTTYLKIKRKWVHWYLNLGPLKTFMEFYLTRMILKSALIPLETQEGRSFITWNRPVIMVIFHLNSNIIKIEDSDLRTEDWVLRTIMLLSLTHQNISPHPCLTAEFKWLCRSEENWAVLSLRGRSPITCTILKIKITKLSLRWNKKFGISMSR